MLDFSFGTLATTEQRLARLRLARSGVTHFHQTEPLDPQPGQPITIHATVGSDLAADRVTLYYTTNGAEPQGSRGQAMVGTALGMEQAGIEWDVLDWGYVTRWRAELPAQTEGTKITYKIGAWTRNGAGEVFADNQAQESGAAGAFALGVDCYRVPDWVWDASIYQIFLDRFYPGDGRQFLDAGTRNGFSGGTLRGAIDKLGYITDLGANCIWLSPCFETPTYHGYHVTDYFRVEPRWGTDQDLRDLVKLAHEVGIRVLLDFVPNHTSNRHPHFIEATSDRNSPFVGWYTFRQWPDDYATFFNVRSLPQINLEHAAARQWMIDAGRYWLEATGIDGYRIDHAYGPSHSFWTDFRRATRDVAPESFMVGEVVEAADLLRTYAGRLDGCLDFMFLDVARRFFAYDSIDTASFDAFLSRHDAYFDRGLVRPTFLDNHDMNRFLWIVEGDKARLKLAATCQFTLPQPPIVYYGTEVGMSQELDKLDPAGQGDAEARRPMVWDERQDADVHAFYRRLFHLRQEHPALRRGQRLSLETGPSPDVLAYGLEHAEDSCVVVLNHSDKAREVKVQIAPLAFADGVTMNDELGGEPTATEMGALHIQLAPHSAAVLTPLSR